MMPPVTHENSRISRAVIPTRVLVVDGEPLIRWSICTALAAEGFDAVDAADAADASRLAAEWPPPRVVLFDLRSPDPAGLAVLSAIQAVYPDCRFLIMTTARDWPPESFPGEGVELMQKPFDLTQLVRVVSGLATRASGAGPTRAREAP